MAVRHYKLVLTTVGPIHIGSGETYEKKDYLSLDAATVGVLDVSAFVSQLGTDELADYCRFLETDSSVSLSDYLGRHKKLWPLARKCIAYRIKTPLAKAPRGTIQRLRVSLCVKDQQFRPFVPGSSVKGMLRTALLSYLIQHDRDTYAALYDSHTARDKRTRRTACQRIEQYAFRRLGPDGSVGGMTDDLMRYISVADSDPLTTDDLVFAKKYDKFARTDSGRHKRAISRDPSFREGNELNVYRECIRPGTRIELALDIDERIDERLNGLVLDSAGMSDVLDSSFALYKRCFLDAFDLGPDDTSGGGVAVDDGRCQYVNQMGLRCRNRSVDGTGYCNMHRDSVAPATQSSTCYLGGGVDFDSKTVVNALLDGKPNRVREMAEILYAQFPTRIDSSVYPGLAKEVRDSGFNSRPLRANYQRGRLTKGKDDHRHWEDLRLGVSPHTAKLGIIGNKKYPMGKCTLEIEER